jgi:hypothetical protein
LLTPITASVTGFSALSNRSESGIWASIASGQLETISFGKRRLILVEPYLRSLGLNPPAYPVTVAPSRFPSLSGLSLSSTWGLIHSGRMKTVPVGRRQMIIVESYRKLIDELKALPRQDARRNTTVLPLGSGKIQGPLGKNPIAAPASDIATAAR